MQVKILCGVSGSGKSTYTREKCQGAVVCSADNWFTQPDGSYKFDPKHLSDAHAECLRQFAAATLARERLIVVDNTNTTVHEVAPYAALALAYGYDLEIVVFKLPGGATEEVLQRVASRNVHDVPAKTIEGQHNRLNRLPRSLPPWWKVSEVEIAL